MTAWPGKQEAWATAVYCAMDRLYLGEEKWEINALSQQKYLLGNEEYTGQKVECIITHL